MASGFLEIRSAVRAAILASAALRASVGQDHAVWQQLLARAFPLARLAPASDPWPELRRRSAEQQTLRLLEAKSFLRWSSALQRGRPGREQLLEEVFRVLPHTRDRDPYLPDDHLPMIPISLLLEQGLYEAAFKIHEAMGRPCGGGLWRGNSSLYNDLEMQLDRTKAALMAEGKTAQEMGELWIRRTQLERCVSRYICDYCDQS